MLQSLVGTSKGLVLLIKWTFKDIDEYAFKREVSTEDMVHVNVKERRGSGKLNQEKKFTVLILFL